MTYRRDAELPFQTLEEETIVVDPKTREVHLLNDTAARVWELLASARSVDELTAALGEEYDAPADELRAGVEELLQGLADKGLLAGGAGTR
ncbi:MAG TPA: PqqD family protein [Polyangia bacterium]|jgi:PqqD family protein of HPr-rel-A system